MKLQVSKLKTNPNNPRVINKAKYKKLLLSIKEFPQMLDIRPIVVNKDFEVLGGNMRLKVLKELGFKETEVLVVDLPIDKQKEFLIKDNLNYGDWDFDALANEWDLSELDGFGLDLDPNLFEVEDAEEMQEDKEDSFNYTICFNNNTDLKKFEKFIKKLDKDYIDYTTTSERILAYINEKPH